MACRVTVLRGRLSMLRTVWAASVVSSESLVVVVIGMVIVSLWSVGGGGGVWVAGAGGLG